MGGIKPRKKERKYRKKNPKKSSSKSNSMISCLKHARTTMLRTLHFGSQKELLLLTKKMGGIRFYGRLITAMKIL
jgi:hypothetical protein